ncbi:hypothetical protein ACI1MP_10595 [Kitasatospora griseola]|uniref:hypothetical protein n=1 Tax=Kitasatospora griseola TaxID=2064 RepID=UPI0038559B9E
MPPTDRQLDAWDAAHRRATGATEASQGLGALDENCWDDVAMRGIVAMALYAAHLRDGRPVDEIRWQDVLWLLRDDRALQAFLAEVLFGCGHGLSRTADGGDPVAGCWRWLTRTWDPRLPGEPGLRDTVAPPVGDTWSTARPGAGRPKRRWDGMTRGIGGGPDPAIEICTPWAAGVVEDALAAQGHGLRRRDRIEVIEGEFAGRGGYVRGARWAFDDEAATVEGPVGYVLDLDDAAEDRWVPADHVRVGAHLAWPQRPAATLKADRTVLVGRPDPATPVESCADHLDSLLGAAANPLVVPDDLRRAIAGAARRSCLREEWGASPHPRRLTWEVVRHTYWATEWPTLPQHPVADLYELTLTRHVNDPAPVHHLALTATDMLALLDQHTAAP